MTAKKPPRSYTREQFEGWIDAAERAVARRYDFRPALPLRDNALFLYLAHRAAIGRIPEGDPSGFEMKFFRLLAICTGYCAGDSTAVALHDELPRSLFAEGDLSDADIADGLTGYLLIHRSDAPELFHNRFVFWVHVGCFGTLAFFLGGLFLSFYARAGLAGMARLWQETLLWLTDENLSHLSLVALGAIGLLLLAQGPIARCARDHETWTALFCVLSEPARRAAYWRDAPILGALHRFFSFPQLGNYVIDSRPVAGAALLSFLMRFLVALIALTVGLIVFFLPDWDRVAENGWPSTWWALIATAAVWIRLCYAEDRRFHREVSPREALIRGVAAWREAELERRG